jgi:hypothetical protein
MSTYLSNALTANVGSTNERPTVPQPPPPVHYLPFLMGHLDEKLLTRLPGNPHPHFSLLYHNQQVNPSSLSPSSNSSSSESYLTNPIERFDHHRRGKLEIQDTIA